MSYLCTESVSECVHYCVTQIHVNNNWVGYSSCAAPPIQPYLQQQWHSTQTFPLRYSLSHTHRHQCAQSMSLWTVVTGSAGSLSYSHCQYLLFRMACIVIQNETVLCQSNCLCLSHLAVVRCCCRFAAVGLAARRYQSIAAQQADGQQQSHHSGVQRPDVGSATLSADVGIWTQTCCWLHQKSGFVSLLHLFENISKSVCFNVILNPRASEPLHLYM